MKDKDGWIEWIEWHGGECPVPKGTAVDYQYRGGGQAHDPDAVYLRWAHFDDAGDIMRYRIAKPAEPPAPDTSAEDALWHGWAGVALGALVQRGVRGDTAEKMAEAAANVADAMLAEAKKRGRV